MTTTTANIESRERSAQLLWTAFILMFFLIQAVIWTIAITLTSGDDSHSVIADYDKKAMEWDVEKARRTASEKLGWQSHFIVAPTGDIRGQREVTLWIRDKNNQPVEGANVDVVGFHRAKSALPQKISFTENEDHSYRGLVTVRKSGDWQFDGTASVGESLFLIHQIQTIQKAGK